VTLAVMQALPGYTSGSGWIRHARAHLGHLICHLPGQAAYNRRLLEARYGEQPESLGFAEE
jgi:hypothetical protein